ncbi:MAG: glycosyltransferase family 4 protein [Ardenticatenaceae bacterium]|nr:glycosyltransferase family 4 protein [Ardenticatenaceae bacterium]
MNVLYTVTSYPPAVGGTQAYTHQLAVKGLQAHHQVQVATHWDESRYDWLLGTTVLAYGEPKKYSFKGVDVYRLGLSPVEKMKILPFVLGYMLFQGAAIAGISDVLLEKLKHMGRDWEIIHNVRQGREGLSFASFKLARLLDIPFVFTPVHHPRWNGWFHRYYRALYQEADAVIALTRSEKELLIEFGVSPERIFVTGNGPVLAADGDGKAFRDRYNLGLDPVVLFLGTKYKYKGIKSLIDATHRVWRKVPDARFVFVGPPTRYSSMIFTRDNDNRIIEIGSVDLQEKTDAVAACDILCVPSSQESFGGVYTEAWAFEKPVIGGDIPAIRDVISDGQDGFLVDQHPDEIADKIITLLMCPDLAAQMGFRGREKVEQQYSWEKLAQSTFQIYEQILSG